MGLAVVAHGARDLRVDELGPQALGEHDAEVALAVGGICGSDLHYFNSGGVGDFTIREPLVLGHELAGVVRAVGSAVHDLAPGARVVIDPSRPCGVCTRCRSGDRNLCSDGRFLGSAARTPHVQGGFREHLVVDAGQCVVLPGHVDLRTGVFAEPLSVALHAVARAGPLPGRHVLVTGAGPIGALIALAARHAGAADVTVTDLMDEPLAIVERMGATHTVNVARDALAMDDADVAFEASGAPAALEACAAAVRPGGTIVLVGLLPPGSVPAPGNRIVTGEVAVLGSFRFVADEFRAAVAQLASGLDVAPLLSHRFPFADARAAFETASRRDEAMKVQLVFSDS